MGVSHGWHLCGAMCVQCEDVRVCRPCGFRVVGCMSDTVRCVCVDSALMRWFVWRPRYARVLCCERWPDPCM